MKVVVVELADYEEWIKGLGEDREWMVQIKQAELSRGIHEELAKVNGFALPLSYDHWILLVDGVRCDAAEFFNRLKRRVLSILPVRVRMAAGYGRTLKEAQLKATTLLLDNAGLDLFLEDFHAPDERVVAAHIDVNYYRGKLRLGVYGLYRKMMGLYAKLLDLTEELGGLSSYLGGDNIVAFLTTSDVGSLGRLADDDVKIGVGVAENARKALALASKALEELRLSGHGRRGGVKVIWGGLL